MDIARPLDISAPCGLCFRHLDGQFIPSRTAIASNARGDTVASSYAWWITPHSTHMCHISIYAQELTPRLHLPRVGHLDITQDAPLAQQVDTQIPRNRLGRQRLICACHSEGSGGGRAVARRAGRQASCGARRGRVRVVKCASEGRATRPRNRLPARYQPNHTAFLDTQYSCIHHTTM